MPAWLLLFYTPLRFASILQRSLLPCSYKDLMLNLAALPLNKRCAWFIYPCVSYWISRSKRFNNPAINRFLEFCVLHSKKTHAQLHQDSLILFLTHSKKNGYFVEFGAADGVTGSNSYQLEKEYAWQGIVAEPAHYWHDILKTHRNCIISNHCVWQSSGEHLTFRETNDRYLSTLNSFAFTDQHHRSRANAPIYEVETISLRDLLISYNAPYNIDYMSIDTEGSEPDILSSFDFSEFKFGLITVEHNYINAQRSGIKTLLEKHGYTRVFQEISCWDDWYVSPELYQSLYS